MISAHKNRGLQSIWTRGEATVSEPSEEAKRQTVLVVDDEAEVRALVRDMLTAHGYQVIDTGDPVEARQIAESRPIHLLLTDVVMPIMSGLELASRVEASSPTTKVLLMSGYATAAIKGSGRPLVSKPFGSGELVGAVRQMLDPRRSAFRRPDPPPASKPGFGPL
jgi:DNA-binding NtrC family response regulator